MNLVEKLLAVDKGIIQKEDTKEIVSSQLTKLTKEETKIKIRAIDGDRFMFLSSTGLDKEGNPIISKAYSTNAKVVAEGVIEPDLKNTELQKHFNATDPADLAKKMFKGEVNQIGDAIANLSGFGTTEQEEVEEIKN